MNLAQLRNIGISAHIDSGKTTLSERILFYTGRIHRMEEVRGNGSGATIDHMDLEKERGITITSAATSVDWNGHPINLIDTPGHVDFTVEVERSLRVLDGAVLVLCAVGGVQSQSMTVDRQMKRYGVPRLAFINKMDRTGADPLNVCQQLRDKLRADAILMQWPIGAGETFDGVVDLVTMKALYFDGSQGEDVRTEAVPTELAEMVADARRRMLDALSMYSDDLTEVLLDEKDVPEDLIHRALRDAVKSQHATPVFLGSAFKNKGIQPLLDAVTRYLPSPLDREISARKHDDPESAYLLEPNPNKPFAGLAFKIVDDPFGQLTFMRVYQGRINKGESHYNQRTGQKQRISRIVRMHADNREEIDTATAGDIVAIMGIDAASGDTYAAERKMCTVESIFVPDPVLKVAISAGTNGNADKLGKALRRFRKEDPTFQVSTDRETNEVLIAGMGELHLEVYIERIRREYRVQVDVSPPKVSYREAPTRAVEFNYKHKKQTGGAGQYAHIVGTLEPLPEDAEETFVFEENIVGGRIPKQFIPAIEKGFRNSLEKGPLAKFPVEGVKMCLTDGSFHDVDSSEMAFQICAKDCFRKTFVRARPVLLEPIMKIEIETPEQFQGSIVGDISLRRGIISTTNMREDGVTLIECEVPLAETFGYASDLRSMSQGQATFTMELSGYKQVPMSIQQGIIEEKRQGQLAGVA